MPAFIAYGILNKTKEFGRIGYVHGKDKKDALRRARILFWKDGYVAWVAKLW